MTLLDPFYGVFGREIEVAKWANRITLLSEASGTIYAIYLQYKQPYLTVFEQSVSLVGILILCMLAIKIINWFLRRVCNLLMVIKYGTTDADEIMASHQRKLERKRQRQMLRERKYEVLIPEEVTYIERPRYVSGSPRPVADLTRARLQA